MKLMRQRFSAVQVIAGFVTGESNEADLAGLLRLRTIPCCHGSEDRSGSVITNDFVELEEIDVIGLEAAERFIELRGGGFLVWP